MKHEFQPILNPESYSAALIYVARQAKELEQKLLDKQFSLDTLTIFAQSKAEYQFISDYLLSIGHKSQLSHGATLYVTPADKTVIHDYPIALLGVRQPDPERPEVGYADFPIGDYKGIKTQSAGNPHVNEIISGSETKLLELKDPDFDIRGYLYQNGN